MRRSPFDHHDYDHLRRFRDELIDPLPPDDDTVFGDAPITAADITEILHERSACNGSCPAFFVRFTLAGRATYVGHAHTPRTGAFVGTMPAGMFGLLASAALRASFFTLDRNYARECTCLPNVRTQVRALDVVKTVENYGAAGPHRLTLLEAMLMRAAESVVWTRAGNLPVWMTSFGG